MYAIDTETQDLGLDPIEPLEGGLVGWDLCRSDWRPGQGEERQRHIAGTAEIAQAHPFVQVAV